MANLIFEETFEGSSFFPENETVKATLNTVHSIENNGDPTSLTVVTYGGRKTARFLLSKALPLYQGDTYRNEVTIVKAEEDPRVTPESWYSFRICFPTDGGAKDARKTSINQWFEDGSDELTLRTMNGTCFLELQNSGKTYRWDLYSTAKTEDGSATGFVLHPLDQFNQFVFHINHKTDATGFIELYRNGVKIHEYHGPTIHLKVPKWKIGIYSSFTSSTVPYKIVFFDDVRVGNNLSSLDEMIGDGVIDPPPPVEPPVPPTTLFKVAAGSDITIPSPGKEASFTVNLLDLAPETYAVKVTATDSNGVAVSDELTVVVKAPIPVSTSVIKGFTLINAETEKSVTPVIEGGIYSISQYGKKFNLKAEIDDAAVTSVKFELTGAQIRTSTDKASPFTLMGDSGTGNYYYGTWGPPPIGSYTLKATPYKGTLALEPSTIHFSFIK